MHIDPFQIWRNIVGILLKQGWSDLRLKAPFQMEFQYFNVGNLCKISLNYSFGLF